MMNKLIKILIFFVVSSFLFAVPGTPGFTGIIDYPTAYNLRTSNYTVTGMLDHIEADSDFGIILEGGFIPQVEAGLKLSTSDKVINQDLLKANFKYQFVQEADNPAMAIGFVEADKVYGYLVMSKNFKNFLNQNINVEISTGLKYDEDEETNSFVGLAVPIFERVRILSEFYSYKENATEVSENEDPEKRYAFNVSGEFYTTDSIRTKVFWRKRDDSFGLSISYIGIYN
ncbi:MAG: hypothetical protein ACQERZ_00265 [Fusobacteriota bacterium]